MIIRSDGADDAQPITLPDPNTDDGLPEMSRNRQGALDALVSPRFREAIRARNIQLIT